jgi:hypothetical protein
MDVDMDKWTMSAYIAHNEAMRRMEEKFQSERDRRYSEVDIEKQKALRIKETADLAALSLARESQQYKDQQADMMRDKSLAASGIYATTADLTNVVEKMEKALKPLVEFVNAQQGADKGSALTKSGLISIITTTGTILTIIVLIANNII